MTIEKKNKLVEVYLRGEKTQTQLCNENKISSCSVFHRWVAQYKQFGTCVDNRGKCTKEQNPKKGRPRKRPVEK